MKLTDRSKGCVIEAAIQAQKVSCGKLREARCDNIGDEKLLPNWEELIVQEDVKRLFRLEKKRPRKATIEWIREQWRTRRKLFWEDLEGKEKQCQIQGVRDEDGVVVEKWRAIL